MKEMTEKNKTITHHEAKHFFKNWIKELEDELRDQDENDPAIANHPEKIDYLNWAMQQMNELESDNGYYN